MAGESKRQKIVDAVTARMELITTAGGYQTNIGSNVHDCRASFQDDELPAVSVFDLEANAAGPSGSNPLGTVWEMGMQIRVYAKRGDDPTNIRTMISDVNKALRVDDRFKVANVGLVMESVPAREGFIIPEDSYEVIGGVVEFTVRYLTKKFNSEE